MLYDRPYMRAPTFGPRAGALKILLISLIVAFVCQSLLEGFVNGGAEFLGKWAMFSGESLLEGKIWTLVTYALLHDGPMHLLFNVLVIFFIGRALEEELGPRALAWLTVFGAVGGASAWCAFNLGAGSLIGASAVATAFLTCFCLRRPEQPITLLLFFVLPCTVKPKWVMWGVLAIELYGFLFMELKGSGGVAHSAHLGGMAVGLAYFARLRSATAGKAAKPRLARHCRFSTTWASSIGRPTRSSLG